MRSDRRQLSSKWNKVLCPRMDSVLEKYFLDGRTWNVSLSSDNVFEVHCFPSVMVDLGLRTCSCRKWEINGYPCQHAVAAIFRSGRNLNSFVEPFFHADMYRQAYSFSIGPVPTVEKPLHFKKCAHQTEHTQNYCSEYNQETKLSSFEISLS
ncbi:hypothetical protein ACSBR1_014305 [Camellia fascicularis]